MAASDDGQPVVRIGSECLTGRYLCITAIFGAPSRPRLERVGSTAKRFVTTQDDLVSLRGPHFCILQNSAKMYVSASILVGAWPVTPRSVFITSVLQRSRKDEAECRTGSGKFSRAMAGGPVIGKTHNLLSTWSGRYS